MKRSLFAALVGALTVLVVPTIPAGAQQSTTVSIGGVSNGAVLQGTVTIKAQGSAATGIERLELSVDGFVVAWIEPKDLRQSATVQYQWNTARSLPSPQPSRNGEHSIKAAVRATGGGSDTSSIKVSTNNPPSTPTGLSASSKGGTISLNWDTNPEPDVFAYRIERDAGAGFAQIAETRQTSFVEQMSAGSYAYRVVAVRSSPTSSQGIASPASQSVSAVVVPSNSGRKTRAGGDGGGLSGGGRRGGSSRGKAFSVGGTRIAKIGLPSGLSLPGRVGLPNLPEAQALEWGRYKKRLPYDIDGPEQTLITGASANIAARSPDRIIPPDGLRWVAAGALLLAMASLLGFFASRLRRPEAAETS
ncbi:MAG: Ig-like domain-containing protein [Actinomycetota bacterium]